MAIVGSRLASVYGRYVTEKISRELALKGITVVSGLARGIDAAAHRGALAGKGRTIAVLGCGLDIVYPPENEALAADRRRPWRPDHGISLRHSAQRPQLSRRGTGSSAGSRSGSSSSRPERRAARSSRRGSPPNRGVRSSPFPGRSSAAGSRGTNRLIKQGAKLIENVEDILEEILPQAGLPPAVPQRAISSSFRPDGVHRQIRKHRLAPLPAETSPVSAIRSRNCSHLIPHDPVGIDHLITTSGLTAQEVLNGLLVLELGGFIRQLPGKLFLRKESEN